MVAFPKRVLITGASGCIGHAIATALLERSGHRLVLAVRDPVRLAPAIRSHDRVELVVGDLQALSANGSALERIDAAILAATSWGEDAHAVNVDQTLGVVGRLDPWRCTRVVYLSTASILSPTLAPWPEAITLGTPYIASKARCTGALLKGSGAPPVTVLYPTVVIGGGSDTPVSHFTRLLGEVARRDALLRFVTAKGSLHLVHASDVASVAAWLVDADRKSAPRQLVLGA